MLFLFPDGFDPQPTLESDLLVLSPLRQEDCAALTQAAGDPAIWAGHPARNRHEAEVFARYFPTLLAIGGALLITDRKTRDVIGCSAFYTDKNAPSRLSIGFTFLTCNHWGGVTNRALKRLMLGHIFSHASEAWFHIAPDNLRSQAATQKLGAVFTHEDQMDLGGGPQSWRCYGLSREAWAHCDGR
ncbi:GNAT family N-acetyltransferase [Yoonia sp. BS5-3]|uniref:GNAT family N-acetyltransferase n=1 Tax=Yoonia phaeophyticola TaxID=3137369 RepID=A0ABZ2V9Y7_9RHOB